MFITGYKCGLVRKVLVALDWYGKVLVFNVHERLVGETKYYCEYNASAMGTVGKYIDSREDVTVIEEEGKYYFYRLEDGRLLVFDIQVLLLP